MTDNRQRKIEKRKITTGFIVLYLCLIGSIVTTAFMWSDVSGDVSINQGLILDVGLESDAFHQKTDSAHVQMLKNDSIIISKFK